jgi:hypothetical protein
VLIEVIAVVGHGLNKDEAQAKFWAESVRSRDASVTANEFFGSFPFKEERTRKSIADILARYGF